jgi:2-phospho-L-lactate guanylyltransferase
MRVVLIPMKPLAAAKERLAPALSAEERRRLSLAMLADVIGAAREFERVWVLNSDEDAADLSHEAGVEAVPDPAPGRGLNSSLTAATRAAIGAGATGILVVSADLPSVRADDLVALVTSPGVAIAPDRAGTGTNALWRAPGDLIDVAFGPNSLAVHAELARAAGTPALVASRPGLALDVDTADDLAEAWRHGVGSATRKALEELGIAARLRLAG